MKSTKLSDGAFSLVLFQLTGQLTIAFVVLKLCNVIPWSWWWVLSPLWIPVSIVAATLVLVIAGSSIVGIARGIKKTKRKLKADK